LDSFTQINQSGYRLSVAFTLFFQVSNMVLITAGSSILAMILTSAPHSPQVSISLLKTRFNRFAQAIEARFSA